MLRKILLIDDDRLQFKLTEAHFRNFRGERYDLEWACSYDEGCQRLLGGDFAACLLDFQLGERDGLQLIREAMARGCRTPIVFLTAEASAKIDTQAMNAGALDYLVKGEITAASLERSLRYALKLGETLDALHRLATHDELTGLFNRREFYRILGEEMERARRFGHAFCLLMVDVDHFKAVNDEHGHQAGDKVLREVARRIRSEIRAVDCAARVGGEEIAVLVVQSDGDAGRDVARRLCLAVSNLPVAAGSQALTITVSVGSARFPQDGATGDDLVGSADRALYAAKARGRNGAICAGEL